MYTVRALLSTQDVETGEEVRATLHVLHQVSLFNIRKPFNTYTVQEFGYRICVSLLQLEVYARESTPNIDAFSSGRSVSVSFGCGRFC
jgi:hypothetical protein